MKTIRQLKRTEAKVQNNLYLINQNKKALADESFLNISNSQIESNIRNAHLKDLQQKQEILMNQLNEIKSQVDRVIDNEKKIDRKTNIKEFLEKFENEKDDYEERVHKYEEQSMLLKQRRMNDISRSIEKRNKQIEENPNHKINSKILLLKSLIKESKKRQEEFIDNDELDVNRMLDVLRLNDGGQSSCPSPNDYLRELDEAEYSFIITITSKLSGSFNSACVARTMCKNPEHVFVIDSKGTAGSIVLIAEKLFELIKENKEFSVITNEITAYRNSINLLFALDRFDNLVRNGRMSKLPAFIAEKIAIKPLCYADDGEMHEEEGDSEWNEEEEEEDDEDWEEEDDE